MKIRTLFCITTLCLASFCLSAQGLSFGFKVGLNFSTLNGDLETDDAGNAIERVESTTGFHVGVNVLYYFTERFGVKGDFLFSQKGTQQFFDGQGAQLFYTTSGEQFGLMGIQNSFLRVTNSYIDIPIAGFAKLGKVEFFGGPSISFLVASKGVGDFQFESGSVIIDSDLDYNYLKDDVPDPTTWEPNAEDFNLFSIDGKEALYPKSVGAYDDFRSKDGNVFKRIDIGLNAGIAYYVNQGLYISGKLNYGLSDLTKSSYDHSRASLDGDQYAPRDDKDRNMTWQVSVGFAF